VIISNIKLKNKEIFIYITILFLFIIRISTILFPINFQQDDISELRTIYFDSFLCAIEYSGDNHPLFSAIIWLISRFLPNPEYLLSSLILITTISSLFLIYKILEIQYSSRAGVFILVILLFSPVLNTYSVALKQYAFEFFTTIFLIRVTQKYTLNESNNINLTKYFFISGFLFLISFVNIFPILLTLTFISIKSKRISYKYLLAVLLFFLPAAPFFIQKLQRVNLGGYWDNFFISNTESFTLLENLYFLLSLFVKSLFVENLNIIAIALVIFSLSFSIISKNYFLIYSSFGFISVFFLSAAKIYPLGGGRTDLLFIPYLCVLVAYTFNYFDSKFGMKNSVIVLFIIFYSLNGFLNSKPYYKNEYIQDIISEVSSSINTESTEIIVSGEQYQSFLYYSKPFVGSKNIQDINLCRKTIPNIKNLTIYSKNQFMKNIEFKKINPIDFNSLNKKSIILIGIELPGTNSQFKKIEYILKSNNYDVVNEKTYSTSMKLSYFKLDE
tara:strand:+ start:756 stop:2255 length:1500 start_codon:yes stop_codon:yes gene_type:complete